MEKETEATMEEESKDIIAKGSQEKTVRLFVIVLGILLVSLIVVLSIFNSDKQATITGAFSYNGFDFKKEQHGYQLQLFVNQDTYPTLIRIRNKPTDLEDIPIAPVSFLLDKKQLYVAIDPKGNLTGKTTIAALEIDTILDNEFLYEIPVNSAFTKPHEDGLVKTCKDVTSTESIIVLELGAVTQVLVQDGCVILQGKTEDDLIRAADRLVFTLIGVME